MKIIILLLYIFFIYSCSNKQKNVPILQNDSITEDLNVIRETILDEKYGYDYFNRTLRDDRIIRYKQSKEHFLKAQRLQKNNEYEAALLELEQAIQLCSQGVYYYHYGN